MLEQMAGESRSVPNQREARKSKGNVVNKQLLRVVRNCACARLLGVRVVRKNAPALLEELKGL